MWFFVTAMALALANLPLLWLPPRRGERRWWRRSGLRRVRRWVTRRRDPGHRHHDGATVAVARRNIIWHSVLGAVFAMLTQHPWLRAGWPRHLRYALVAACAAYLLGSLVQRQKIVIAADERRRRQA